MTSTGSPLNDQAYRLGRQKGIAGSGGGHSGELERQLQVLQDSELHFGIVVEGNQIPGA